MTKFSKILIVIITLILIWLFLQTHKFEYKREVRLISPAQAEMILNFTTGEEVSELVINQNALWGSSMPFYETTPKSVQDVLTLEDLIPNLLQRIIWCESRNNPNASNPSGAKGLAQFMPETWKSTMRKMGLPENSNPLDGELNLKAAQFLFAEQGVNPWLASENCWR